MKALGYHGPGQKSWDDVLDPRILDDTDAIIGVDATTGLAAVMAAALSSPSHIVAIDLADTWSTPTLLKLVRTGQLAPHHFVTHRFALPAILEAYDVFSRAADTGALKVLLHR